MVPQSPLEAYPVRRLDSRLRRRAPLEPLAALLRAIEDASAVECSTDTFLQSTRSGHFWRQNRRIRGKPEAHVRLRYSRSRVRSRRGRVHRRWRVCWRSTHSGFARPYVHAFRRFRFHWYKRFPSAFVLRLEGWETDRLYRGRLELPTVDSAAAHDRWCTGDRARRYISDRRL